VVVTAISSRLSRSRSAERMARPLGEISAGRAGALRRISGKAPLRRASRSSSRDEMAVRTPRRSRESIVAPRTDERVDPARQGVEAALKRHAARRASSTCAMSETPRVLDDVAVTVRPNEAITASEDAEEIP
jgi:hypothetical protein